MNKIKFFYLLLASFFVFFLYILIGIYSFLDYKKYGNYVFQNLDDLKFHYKYSNKINHLRKSKYNNNKTGYLFNKVVSNNSKNKMLFLGDSWFEQINQNEYKQSLEYLKKISLKNNIEILNAGITSFSPSLMQIQYQILKKNFQIDPSILIVYIDQTDIGDEFCRYKDRKIYDKTNNLKAVKRFDYDKEIFNGIKIYKYSEIKFKNNYLKKFIYITNFNINYFAKKNLFRVSKIIEHGWKTSDEINYYKCRFKVIKSFLEKKNIKANLYFEETLYEFFKILNNDKKIKKIIINTFPHKNHINGVYKNNVSTLVDNVIKNFDDRFIHFDFSDITFENFNLEELFVKGDQASHLTPEFHKKLFLEEIIKKVSF